MLYFAPMMHLFMIFFGGGCGSLLRYGMGQLLPHTAFPWATFAVNTLGGLAIGLLSIWSERFGWSDSTRLGLTIGLCGGFTTFSTFSKETLTLLTTGRPLLGLTYILSTLLVTLGAVAIGAWLAKPSA